MLSLFQEKNKVLLVAISIIVGSAIGLLVGVLLNQVAYGIILGAALGTIVGAIIYSNKRNDNA